MNRFESDEELIAELRESRPEPDEEFAAELDERASAGFPRGGVARRARGLVDRLRAVPPRRIALPVGATALVAIAVATAAISVTDGGPGGDATNPAVEDVGRAPSVPGSGAAEDRAAGVEYQGAPPTIAGSPGRASAPIGESATSAGLGGRAVERSASLVLATDSSEVPAAAAEVFQTVRAQSGVVLRSEIEDGEEASAEFELLIPSGRVSDAMGALSAIAEVRARKDESADITAPTVDARERVRDSRARVESLLGQLAKADDETERAAAERRLRAERRTLAHLERRLSNLRDRARMSRVSLRIESADASLATGWGITDALEDAGDVLAVAAGVTIVSLAVLGPIALLVLLGWLARRAWLHLARRRALG